MSGNGITVSDTSYLLENMSNGTYYYQICAFDAAGNMSDWSAAQTFTVDYDPRSKVAYDVPEAEYMYGCLATAVGMMLGYYDRYGYMGYDVGIWRVGGGNYAGNGIYFAPVRSTAKHYSSGSLIICRVTLGPTLDLGLAPYHVFSACGHPDATEATSWGLENGYVTGEWWRPDERWWEYCMYDWQNRYNYSWRIRPLYVLDLNSGNIQRIPGGMCHWLFRKMVIKDIFASLE